MASFSLRLLLAVAAVAAVATGFVPDWWSSGGGQAVAAGSARLRVNHDLAGGILAEVNRVRRRHGLRELRSGPALRRAATGHVRFLALAGKFTHDWPAGTPFARWIPRFYSPAGMRFWSVGENLVWSNDGLTPREALRLWLRSPSHRETVLDRRWRKLGVAVIDAARAPGTYGGSDVVIAATEFGVRTR